MGISYSEWEIETQKSAYLRVDTKQYNHEEEQNGP